MAKSINCPECGDAMTALGQSNHLFQCDNSDCLVSTVEIYWKALSAQAAEEKTS